MTHGHNTNCKNVRTGSVRTEPGTPKLSGRAGIWKVTTLRVVPALVVLAMGAAAAFPGASAEGAARQGLQNAATQAADVPVAFPLKVSKDRRYLVDQHGVPFLVVGDSPQAMIVKLSELQAGEFIADRQAAGFNSLWINLLCNTYTGGRADGATYDGIRPFSRPGHLSRPNPAYFRRVASIIRLAARKNMAVFLDPIETGGWLKTLQANGVKQDYAYGRYLGRVFRRFPNIVWLNGNDFLSWTVPADDAVALAVARGIRATDPAALQTVELDYPVSSSLDDSRWEGRSAIDSAYTYFATYNEVLKDRANPNRHPIVMVEASYEFEHFYTGPETLRREEYWTALSGAAGQFYGNKYTWQFLPGWRSHLDTPGSTQMGYLTSLLGQTRWYALVPDTRHLVITAGYGTYGTPETGVNSSDYVTAASTPDGKLAIAYLPDMNKVSVNLAAFTGPVDAEWYDPSSGVRTTINRSPFANTGTATFTPAGPNADGDGDWVLLLTAS